MRPTHRTAIEPAPVQVVCGSSLCLLRVWSDAEWVVLPETERPTDAVNVPGLAWVGAVPTVQLN